MCLEICSTFILMSASISNSYVTVVNFRDISEFYPSTESAKKKKNLESNGI